MSDGKFYLTTPIYYVNFKPHIGTSYTTILTDVVARYKRFCGADVRLVTGSDEHSQNIADLAEQAKKTPRAYCDEMIPRFTECWELLNIQNYHFERTSDAKHHRLVRAFWQQIHDKGDVYEGTYAGWYHTTDNRYLDADEVPPDPENHPRLKYLTEASYYFRLSAYQDWLLSFHEANPTFVVPDFRRNEMLARIKKGLSDICISRSSTTWGIPLPWDEKHVFYVWIDALLTYLTGSGFDVDAFLATCQQGISREVKTPAWDTTRADLQTQPQDNDWPADLHVMAKDIPWFHAVIWPAMLHSFGVPPPKQLLVHGYWQFGGEKMSKSLGNVVDPYDAAKLVGADGLRYFLMREVPPGRDGNFNYDALLRRYNFDLANDLGNLVHRTVSLLHQLFDGVVPALSDTADDDLETQRKATIAAVQRSYGALQFSDALQQIWALVALANQYVDKKKPWELKKQPARRAEVGDAFYRLLETIRTVALLAYPVIPGSANRFWRVLNLPGTLEQQREAALQAALSPGHRLNPSEAVFTRVSAELLKLAVGEAPASGEVAKSATPPTAALATDAGDDGANLITCETFGQVELRVAEVRQAEKVEKADKLLRLVVFDGTSERQIVAGIAKWYTPEEMRGKLIVIVANLKPAKLRGLLSQGMLLAAEDSQGRLSLVTVQQPLEPGARVR